MRNWSYSFAVIGRNAGIMEASWITWSAAAALCAAVWGACRWWYGRSLGALRLHLDKVDRARQHAVQQGLQLRKQVEKLQKEMSETRRASTHAAVQRGRERHLESVLSSDAAQVATASAEPVTSPHGFADTLPM